MKYLTFNVWHPKQWSTMTFGVLAAHELKTPSDADRRGVIMTSGIQRTPDWVHAYDAGCRSIVVSPNISSVIGDKRSPPCLRWYVKNEIKEINEYLLAVDMRKE